MPAKRQKERANPHRINTSISGAPKQWLEKYRTIHPTLSDSEILNLYLRPPESDATLHLLRGLDDAVRQGERLGARPKVVAGLLVAIAQARKDHHEATCQDATCYHHSSASSATSEVRR